MKRKSCILLGIFISILYTITLAFELQKYDCSLVANDTYLIEAKKESTDVDKDKGDRPLGRIYHIFELVNNNVDIISNAK